MPDLPNGFKTMPRFLLRNIRFDDVSRVDLDQTTFAAANDSDEVLVVDERCRQSRSSFVEEKFSQLVSLAASRYSSYTADSTN